MYSSYKIHCPFIGTLMRHTKHLFQSNETRKRSENTRYGSGIRASGSLCSGLSSLPVGLSRPLVAACCNRAAYCSRNSGRSRCAAHRPSGRCCLPRTAGGTRRANVGTHRTNIRARRVNCAVSRTNLVTQCTNPVSRCLARHLINIILIILFRRILKNLFEEPDQEDANTQNQQQSKNLHRKPPQEHLFVMCIIQHRKSLEKRFCKNNEHLFFYLKQSGYRFRGGHYAIIQV